MAEIKLLAFLINLLGFSAVIAGILTNLDNIKSGLLFMSGCVYLWTKIYNGYQDARKKKMDNDEKHWELTEKHKHDKHKP